MKLFGSCLLEICYSKGALGWLSQLKHRTSAQVMISQFVGSSPASGSVLTAQGLEPASDSVSLSLSLKNKLKRGTWVAQSVKRLTLAQVVISQFVSSSPASGSVLTAQSLEPASDSVSPSLSVPSPLMLSFSLSLKNKH